MYPKEKTPLDSIQLSSNAEGIGCIEAAEGIGCIEAAVDRPQDHQHHEGHECGRVGACTGLLLVVH